MELAFAVSSGQSGYNTMVLHGVALASLLVFLVLYIKLLEYLDVLAWKAAKERMVRDDAIKDRPPLFTEVRKGWVFTGIGPDDWGVENIFHLLIHRPVYVWQYFKLLTYYLPRDFSRRYIFRQDVSDQVILNLVLNTSLVLLCETDSTGELVTYRCESCGNGIFINVDKRSDCMIDGSTLVVHFRSGYIESAATGEGQPVTAGKWLTRNEILADALLRTLALWAHPQTHVAGERCAGEIGRNQIDILSPSGLHCHSVHVGLLHGSLSPIQKELNFLTWVVNRMAVAVNGLANKIPHNLHRIKTPKKFRYFNYLLRAHAVTIKILKKYNLAHVINADDFFALVVMHDLEHASLYQAFCDKVPLRANHEQDRFHYYLSMYQSLVMNYIYVPPIVNPLWSMLIKDSTNPFFQDFYRELARIDPEFAGYASYNLSY
jgi:hypothetical protein